MESLGHYGFWGLSATFDFCELLDNAGALESGTDEPIRILLVQPGDIRHILTTISRRRRLLSSRRPIHFYLLESLVEIIGRDLLLLECINDFEVPIRQRANIFLEIFGNVKVQDRTCRYVEQLGYQLRELVAHSTGRLEDLVDLSLLKYRDKDELETVFKGYSRSVPFDIETLWDTRLRGYYKERYDSRKALADWDWHYSIKEVASIVHVKLYKDWRLRGVAFEFGDQTYTEPNRTFLSYAPGVMKVGKDKGMKKEVKGYWSDVIVSPYFTFGYDSETPNSYATGLYEIMNKDSGTEQHRHHTVEVVRFLGKVMNIIDFVF
jgi:dynein assembly factor 3, axonemal